MKLRELDATNFKSLRALKLRFEGLNLLIGANASGKSNVLDALRFLSEAMRERDFVGPTAARGSIIHVAWKGEAAQEVGLKITVDDDQSRSVTWSVGLKRKRRGLDFRVHEQVHVRAPGENPHLVLEASDGSGWWWSGDDREEVPLKLDSTACAFAAAAADASFPARDTAAFVRGWGFFDPSPVLLRRASTVDQSTTLESFGRNLAARLHSLKQERRGDFDRIVSATKSILGVPQSLEFRVSEQSVYFTQLEPGLEFRVHQVGASSGTLRILALMTALLGESEAGLIGIEEPENQIHPAALQAFAEYLRSCAEHLQIVVTTHSPLLLDYLDTPEAVCVVRRTEEGTVAFREDHPEAVRAALRESGFALGEFYETKGFGA